MGGARSTAYFVRGSDNAVEDRMSYRFLILACMLGITFALTVRAQDDEPRTYVPIPFDPNFEAKFKDRLKFEKQLGPLKDLVRQIIADPNKLHIDPKQLKDFKLDDPQFKKALQDWAANDPQLKQALQDWISKNPVGKQPDDVKQMHDNLKTLLDQSKPPMADPKTLPEFPKELPKISQPPRPDNAIPRAVERAMQQAENSNLGEWLRDSPAWRRAFSDLKTSLDNPNNKRWGMRDIENKLKWFEGKNWKPAENALDRLREMPRPNWERFRWDRPVPGLGRVRAPNLPGGLPDFSAPSLPTIGVGVSWLLFLAVLALLVWLLLRWAKKQQGEATKSDAVTLGPWPVRADAVTTRADLVLAFDHLARLTLGAAAEYWNHRVIASQWSAKTPACTPVANGLAQLYEMSRYSQGDAALSETERTQARLAIAQIAEAA